MNTGFADLQMSRFVNTEAQRALDPAHLGLRAATWLLLKVLTETNQAVGTLKRQLLYPHPRIHLLSFCTCPPVFIELVKRIIEQMKLDNGLLVREDTKGRHGGVHTLWYLHFQRNQCTNLYTLFHFYGHFYSRQCG